MKIFKTADELVEFVKKTNKARPNEHITITIKRRKIVLTDTLFINFNLTIKTEQKTFITTQRGTPVFQIQENCQHFILDGRKGTIVLTRSDSPYNRKGGAIVNLTDADITIKNTIISDSVSESGGAIYTEGNLTLERVSIINNIAKVKGGGVFVRKNLIMKESRLKGNIVSAMTEDTVAALDEEDSDLAFSGGAINVDAGHVKAINCDISSNIVEGGVAGAILLHEGTLTIENSLLQKNNAYAISCLKVHKGILNINQSRIVRNRSNSTDRASGGTISMEEGVVNVNQSKISHNITHGMFSSGIVSMIGDVNVKDSEFSGNKCNGPGGAIACNFGSNLYVENSVIKNNVAAGLGSAFVNFSLGKGGITIVNSKISNNTLTDKMTIREVVQAFKDVVSEAKAKEVEMAMKENPAIGDSIAGAVAALFCKITIKDSELSNNSTEAAKTCGTTLFSGKDLEITGSVIKNNKNEMVRGKALGTIYVSLGKAQIENTEIISNRADVGGGLYINQHSDVLLKKSRISRNTALQGGGVYDLGEFTHKASLIKNNNPDDVNTGKKPE